MFRQPALRRTNFVLFSVCLSILPLNAFSEDVEIHRFERTTVCSGLVQPMEMDFASGGRIFLIELSGTVKLIDPNTSDVKIVGKVDVTTAQENGLIGLALDPNFDTNHWVYLQYSPPDFSGQRISRFDFRDNQIDLASEKRLFSYEEQRRECCHHAGSMEFGLDGNLYIGTGDNTNPFNDSGGFAPIDERPDREPWDAQRSAGNTKSYNGKVLRIHPEQDGTYSIPDGNLFPKDGAIGYPEIYVMGCRNPWRINVDKKTGFLYWGDVGPDAGQDDKGGPRGYDEINQARTAGNFGWPYFIGNNYAYPIVNFTNGEIGLPQDPAAPLNQSVNNTGSKQLPAAQPAMIYYPAGISESFPEVGTGGRTACAGPVYHYDEKSSSTTKFPVAYDSTLFAFEWSRNWIMAVHLDTNSKVQRLERFLPDMKFVRPIDLRFDNNGALFVIEYGETWGVNPDAKLVRIDYIRGNRAPVAIAKAKNEIGPEPLVVELSAMESSDKDGDQLSYVWTAIRSGATAESGKVFSTTADTTIRFDEPGVYTIQLVVKDTSGAKAVATLPAIVGNSVPNVEFLTPHDGDFFTPGKPVPYRLVVRDREDGTSVIDEAEEGDAIFIDSTAPSRLFVEAVPVSSGDDAGAVDPPGLALIRHSDCLNCHAPNRALVGPSFIDIANKYRNQPHQVEQSVTRVLQGSTGVWGKVGMLPHQQHTPAEVRQMVAYVFSVTVGTANSSAQGFSNELVTAESSAGIRLEATYTDLGRGEIPKSTGMSVVTLRSRNLQAESAVEFKGTQRLGANTAQGNQFMGAIEHDGFLRFSSIPLDNLRNVIVRVASAGAGGTIEIHRGKVDGPLLGKTSVEVNGDWVTFYEKTIALSPANGRDEIYIVFKNPINRGGLMNIDSVNFQ